MRQGPHPIAGASLAAIMVLMPPCAVTLLAREAHGAEHPARDIHPHALERLRADAARAMETPPLSVTMKSRAPASGDLHDYTSMGPYWWPDPAKPDGLPYIRRDGEVNPESRGERSDSPRLGRMATAVETLAASWHFTGNEKHARHAALLLRTWFLDPSTRMNPHLEYSQAIPGICDGRGIGVIDGARLIVIPEAVLRLRGAAGWTAADEDGMRKWLGSFLDWILTSRHGREADAARNNHGTWRDVQCVVYARFLGKNELAAAILKEAPRKRIASQIEADGRQPHETGRTKSWGYSVMNLRGLMILASCAEGSGTDLWHYETADGRGIRQALLYLAQHMESARPWPHANLGKADPDAALPLIAASSRVYPPDQIGTPLRARAQAAALRDWRTWSGW